ncbi:DNA-nicking Smr family endonuclease [Rhizobium sp. SG_E_25_P2]|jgi:DNA-nicking Smr family endonuclease|uniref:Smr/MutS family protein n=1 Tax=Rhizobium sp. SG_E_25_P2 TaxID=2879942 RepID=UPI0024731791|nr:Smr/MutS family protein [Rhizobium sp. SG_E_25_P2]MDH6269332.1 DNA-nicking Smr family endonuclease [Rhizobium sp. SG_E_25_P2]
MATDKKLSTEDRILWGKVARTTRALPGRIQEIDAFEALMREQESNEANAPPVLISAPSGGGEAAPPPRLQPARHHPLEKPVKRKLAKGRLELEARIDLHGLFQSEAHAILHSFLIRAYERGLRHVLVITGKGGSIGSDGALRRAVPMWFSKPDFRPLISSYEPAAANHGGDGALYVRLARSRGERA